MYYDQVIKHRDYFTFTFMLNVAGSKPDKVIFLIYLILPAALGPGVYSSSNRNRNKYQKQNVSGE
jgi:hypothetical protein